MLVLFTAVAGGASGCVGEARAVAVDGTLVLELGGPHASLRAALRVAGVHVEPRSGRQPGVVPAVFETADDPPAGLDPQPSPPPRPRPTFSEVELRQNETLIQLARRHLGDGRRYRELMKLNGWSDSQSRRLAPGTMVKLPLEGR